MLWGMKLWLGPLRRLPTLFIVCLLAVVLPACTGVGGGGGDEEGIANTPPRITSLQFSAFRGEPLDGQLTAIDLEGGTLTFEGVTQTTNGTITVNANGSFRYVPTPNFVGRDEFIARVTDPQGLSSTATIGINTAIRGNLPPTLTSLIFTVTQGQVLNGQLTATDPENDPVTFAVVTPTTNGTLTVQPTGAFVYTPAPAFSGTDTFTVRVTDARGAFRIGTVTITVVPVPNQPPTITSLTFTVTAGRPFNGQLTAVDPENQAFTFTRETVPANGTVTVQPNGAFVYTPNAGFTGADTWFARVTDVLGATSAAQITMNVVPNGPPVAVDDVFDNDPATATIPPYTVVSPTEISLPVTANDTDPNDPVATLTAQVETAVPLFGGTAATNDAGSIRVTLPAGFRGLVRLQYRAVDPSNATSNVATAIAFVDTAAFNVSFIGNEFGAARELALADLLQPPRRVNGALTAGNVTSYFTAPNGRTFAYVVDRLNAFVATSAALGTGNALYTAAVAPGNQHVGTAINADGSRVCSSYIDFTSDPLGTVRSFLATTTPANSVALPVTNNPECFAFRANGTDVLLLGRETAAAPFRDGLYQVSATAPATLALLTRPNSYEGFTWQRDKVFLSPDTNRLLFLQRRVGVADQGVFELNLAAPATETALSQEFSLIGQIAASPARDRIAFAPDSAAPFRLLGYDRAAPTVPIQLYSAAQVTANSGTSRFSSDGARIGYITSDNSTLCDTPFGGPFGCSSLLTGFNLDQSSLFAYDATASNVIAAARSGTTGDYRLLQVPRPAGGPVDLAPNNLFLPLGQSFSLTTDSAVIAVGLRDSPTGPLRVYLINRAVPGQVLQVSVATTVVDGGSVRFTPR
jgi:VCBS repeat-containing protein